MTQEIIAYLADDGQIFLCRDDADFADYQADVGRSSAAFLAQRPAHPATDPIDLAALVAEWELWRLGGRAGWTAMQATLPVAAPVVASVEPPPELSAAVIAPPSARAKPGPKPKVEKAPTVIADALVAARIVRERQLAEARPGTVLDKVYRKHVAVVGLFNIHHKHIEREFGEALKLSLHDADCLPKLNGLRGYHKVILMTKFISHKHVAVLKSIGQEPLMVSGGIDKLKEALTTIYVNS